MRILRPTHSSLTRISTRAPQFVSEGKPPTGLVVEKSYVLSTSGALCVTLHAVAPRYVGSPKQKEFLAWKTMVCFQNKEGKERVGSEMPSVLLGIAWLALRERSV